MPFNIFGGYVNSRLGTVDFLDSISKVGYVSKWESFEPTFGYPPQVRCVQLTVFGSSSSIRVQFMYNRETNEVSPKGIYNSDGKDMQSSEIEKFFSVLTKYPPNTINNSDSGKILSQQSSTTKTDEKSVTEENKLLVGILERPDKNSYFQYTSNEWMDMSRGFEYGADHPIKEETIIRETISRIIVDFKNKKSIIYEIVTAKPYEYGINYTVEYNGKRKTITKSKEPGGSYSFSLEHEWMVNQIFEAVPAGID
ncbi:MAG: hypothetical protein WCG45_01975 [bacterium]